jgi:hypothetical protein
MQTRAVHRSADSYQDRGTIRANAMTYDIPPPENLPEPGVYYHFKHDPDGPVNNYAYYIYGVGHHTEDDCRTEDAFIQVYTGHYTRRHSLPERRPLRPAPAAHVKPAEWKGKRVKRFTRIVDPGVIAQLAAIKTRMYPSP